MKLLEHFPPATGDLPQPSPEVIIPEARKRGRRRRLGIGIVIVLVVAAAGAVGGVIGNGGSRVHTPVQASAPSEGPSSSGRLYRVTHSIVFPAKAEPDALETASSTALYVSGQFFETSTHGHPDNLMRVQLQPLAVTTTTYVSGLNDAAFGLGALWAAAGDLVRMNPTSLAVTARFALPEPALVVIVAGGTLWVGTPTSLLAVNPGTGTVEHANPLGFRPYTMAVSPDGRLLYVIGDSQDPSTAGAVLSSFNATTGAPLGQRTLGIRTASIGPIAATKDGAWVSVMNAKKRTPTATISLYKGPTLVRRAQTRIGHQGAATVAYIADHVLWLIDGSGTSKTKCASAASGRIRATGSARVTSENGAMLSVNGRAFLLGNAAPRRSLLEINPTSACMY